MIWRKIFYFQGYWANNLAGSSTWFCCHERGDFWPNFANYNCKNIYTPVFLLDSKHSYMVEYIFGVLYEVLWWKIYLLQLKKIEQSIDFINMRPKPLALYAFTLNEALKTRIVSETSSGSVTFNDVLIQVIPAILWK